MNKVERKKMVLAMEYIARQINDEDVLMGWLMCGVPDGDLEYGEWDVDKVDDSLVDDDRDFAELMECFLRRMKDAERNGGLYCDGIITGSSDIERN